MIKAKYKFRDFLPLIIIFLVIGFFTFSLSYNNDSTDLFYVMRIFMAGFFLVFGFFKIIKLNGFAMAYKEYDLLAKRSNLYAHLYPFIEIALGLAYLLAFQLFLTNIITLIVMSVSAWGVWLKIRKREEVTCACLGTVFKFPMTYVTFFEDTLMALMAVYMLLVFL